MNLKPLLQIVGDKLHKVISSINLKDDIKNNKILCFWCWYLNRGSNSVSFGVFYVKIMVRHGVNLFYGEAELSGEGEVNGTSPNGVDSSGFDTHCLFLLCVYSTKARFYL